MPIVNPDFEVLVPTGGASPLARGSAAPPCAGLSKLPFGHRTSTSVQEPHGPAPTCNVQSPWSCASVIDASQTREGASFPSISASSVNAASWRRFRLRFCVGILRRAPGLRVDFHGAARLRGCRGCAPGPSDLEELIYVVGRGIHVWPLREVYLSG